MLNCTHERKYGKHIQEIGKDITEWSCEDCGIYLNTDVHIWEDIDYQIWERIKEFPLKENIRRSQLLDYIREIRPNDDAEKHMDNLIEEKGWDWVKENFKIFLD